MMLVPFCQITRACGLDWLSSVLAVASETAAQATGSTPAVSEPTLAWPMLLLVVRIAIGIITLGIVLCIYRILRGPHLADRVLSADVLSLMLVALVILITIETGNTIFMDAALVVAIIGFASTVAFAQYIGARPGLGDRGRGEGEEG